ncbi:hypothetical protein, partial [Frankia sp. AgW1.1]
KFFSKFEFAPDTNLDTQHGAAPFSFLLIAIDIMYDVLDDISVLSDRSRLRIADRLVESLALQTRYFAAERRADLTPQDVLEMKQREVSGQTLGVVADILSYVPSKREVDIERLRKGLVYLGSLTQITDDIRDMDLDRQMHNANIVNSYVRVQGGSALGALADTYDKEATLASEFLDSYTTEELSTLMSLPLYPFVIDKSALRPPGAPQ